MELHIKKFINLDGQHRLGAIGVGIEKGAGWNDYYGEILISDCNRIITLHLEFENEETFDNNLFKIDTMIEVLKEAREFCSNRELITKVKG